MSQEPTDRPVTVVVADDEPAVRDVLSDLLSGSPGLHLVGQAADTDEAVRLASELRPDVVLLDVRMRHSGGSAATRDILAASPSTRVVALSAYSDPATILEMLHAGAVGYVVKGGGHTEVVDAVCRASRGHADISVETLRTLLDQATPEDDRARAMLSVRQGPRREDRHEGPARRRQQMRSLIRVQEEERKRIAADIHDDSLQIMAVATMRLGMLRDLLSDPDQQRMIDQTRESVQGAVKRLRGLLFELRPRTLDLEGLAAALETYLEETLEESGVTFSLRSELSSEPPSEVRTVVYRIAQEALVNVRKHAAASRVEVHVSQEQNGVHLLVRDDGRGFDPGTESGPGHIGLTTIRERAESADGWARVTSDPGNGTTIEAWVPVTAED